MSIITIIPARKSSRRLKNKNILKIKGMSLVDRVLNDSKKIKFTSKIILTTDISKSKFSFDNKKFIFIKRPKNLAGDNSKIYKTILYIVKYLKKNTNLRFDSILMLQATSPFRSIQLINKAYKIFKKNKKKYSVASLTDVSTTKDYKDHLRVFDIKNNRLFLQNKINGNKFIANGNFYFASINFIKKNKSLVSEKKTIPFIIKSKKLSIDIDERKDYLLAKKKA